MTRYSDMSKRVREQKALACGGHMGPQILIMGAVWALE